MNMKRIEERYISLLTDFGFKRIFGTKPNKDLLINFLNSLFDGFQVIKDVKYLNSEHVGDVFAERKAIFDVYCENEHGEKFIVEMQNAYQKYFKDRSLFYSTFPIREQAPKGAEWNFKLEHVYTVALLNFDLEEEAFDKNDINHDVGLLDKKTFKVFNDKLSFKYVEIAKFNKTEEELDTLYDKWLYVLKNLSRLGKRPAALKEKVFTKLFEEAEIAKFTPTELKEYEDSLKAYRDVKNSIDTALEKGREEGMAEGMAKGMAEGMEKEKQSTARRLLSMGLSEEQVSTATELPLEVIQKLREQA
uniref:Rpn family recombination-promoting nuclease/putative transposase n=1 Tax=Segatella hominis TaxID=2518605 RepID=UPI004038E097